MEYDEIPSNQIFHGDCIEVLQSFREKSIDLIFADPPYNLQLEKSLWRPDMTLVKAVDDGWDHFRDFETYDEFTRSWLSACRRVLKDTGTIWVIGSYHNIFRVGTIMQNLGFWFLNDVIWIKKNPMPNFRGVRFTNAHETLVWACREKSSRYTFNHQALKGFNEEKQMRSDWYLPICTSPERINQHGKRAHSTQKPEALLYRVILASTNPGDLILDPFFGMGTTGVVAKRLHRNFLGIEREANYVELASQRILNTQAEEYDPQVFNVMDYRRHAPRVAFPRLLEAGLLSPGQKLYFKGKPIHIAWIKPDGQISYLQKTGSIHQIARSILEGKPCNGWELWFYKDKHGKTFPIDNLREVYRKKYL